MKSIEEKARAYDKVVEKAKMEKEKSRNLGLLEFIDKNFPELKESEDERIKEDIISFVEQAIDAGYGIIDKERKDKWIAWLEKQGKQKCISPTMEEKAEIDGGFTEMMLKGEQKPCGGDINDEALQQQLQIWFEKGKCSGKDEVIYHPENFGLQKSAEWSEEDEKKLIGICNYISCSDSPEGFEEWIDWLKSLRPQNRWKPSIAQLNALSIVSKGNAPDDIEAIVSLYNDLKKLKEE